MKKTNHSDAHVLVLAGGLSHERDVSLRSGRRISKILKESGFKVTVRDLDEELLSTITDLDPDVIWPVLHGATGEDGTLADLLQLLGRPFIGSAGTGARVSWSKPIAKSIISRAGGHTPASTTFTQPLFRDVGAKRILDLVSKEFTFPLVVKPTSGGSALGVNIVHTPQELPQAMVTAFAYHEVVMVEEYIKGLEVAVSVADLGKGPIALPAVEIDTDGLYDYDARYNPGRSEYFVPARLSPEQLSSAENLALLAHNSLGLRHYSRTDMRITADGQAHFLEVNVAPGLTETSLFPLAAQSSDQGVERIYRTLVDLAMIS